MTDIKDLIEYENECTWLDFKLSQYTKSQYVAFLKDIMAMANADSSVADRYFIIGVKPTGDGNRVLQGLSEPLVDAATYQQLLAENVEPGIQLNYVPFKIEGITFGVFSLSDCKDRPYMMKKDYLPLRKGDCLIRKGTFQMPWMRSDYDRLMAQQSDSRYFSGEIDVVFKSNGTSHEKTLVLKDVLFPSDIAAKKIKETIEIMDLAEDIPSNLYINNLKKLDLAEYSHHTPAELRKALENIKKDKAKEDFHYLFEEKAFKLNLQLLNKGVVYVEDALIQIQVPAMDGLDIGRYIPRKPTNNPMAPHPFSIPFGDEHNYPKVIFDNGVYTIEQSIGDLKHHIPVDAFLTPLRVVLLEPLKGKVITFVCRLFGRNLKRPLEKELTLEIIG